MARLLMFPPESSSLDFLKRFVASMLLGCTLAAGALGQTTKPALQAPPLFRKHHAWARFNEGAWKKARITTETLDPRGNVVATSVSESTTLLDNVSDRCYALETERSVELQGKRFDAQSQYVSREFSGEPVGKTPLIKDVSSAVVTIEDKEFPCQVYQFDVRDGTKTKTTRLYYSRKAVPHLLKKVSTTRDERTRAILLETTETVVARDMPYKVGSKITSTSHILTVHRSPQSTTTTLAIHTPEVPGGVVQYTSKELDSEGRVLRRSRLELVDYGLEDDGKIFRRRGMRTRRAQRKAARAAR